MSVLKVLWLAPLTSCLGLGCSPADTGGSGAGGTPANGGSAASAGASNGGTAASSGGSTLTGGATTITGGAAQLSGGSAPLAGSSGTGGSSGAGAGGTGGVQAGNTGSGGAPTAGAGGTQTEPMPPYTFPQNVRSPNCVYPVRANPEHVRAAYQAWKDEIVTSDGAGGFLRTRRPNSPGSEADSTVSEGIAYGMIIGVMMDDQPMFDALFQYTQLWLNENGLMHWYINAAGTQTLGTGGATDSDEDIAWALIMAHRKWGGSGSLSTPYLDLARTQVQAVWDHEIDHTRNDLVLPGDTWGDNIVFNPSYFAPNQYRLFGELTDNVAGWNRVIDTGYALLEACLNPESGNDMNGLAPAWCGEDGAPKQAFDGGPTHYQYDSARVPFRIGQDYCYSGEPRARAYLAKVSAFFAAIGASSIVDGYDLDGTPRPDEDSDPNGPQSAVFVGSAAIGAMHDPEFQAFVDQAYDLVATGELLARSRYYNLSWTALGLLMLTGNLIEYP